MSQLASLSYAKRANPRYIVLLCGISCELAGCVSSAVSPTVTSVHARVFTHALAGTHVLACISLVIGSSVAGVVAL
jgi:hypothetical protein